MPRMGIRRLGLAIVLIAACVALSAVPDFGLVDVVVCLLTTAGILLVAAASGIYGVIVARRTGWKAARVQFIVATSLMVAAVACIPTVKVLEPYLQLAMQRGLLKEQAEQAGRAGSVRLAAIQTDSALLMASGIALDESDQIALPFPDRSATWRRRARETPLGDQCWGVARIVGHYYRWGGDGTCP
jgi:hypothetical protein